MLIVLRFNSLLDAQLCSGVFDRNCPCQEELRSFMTRYSGRHTEAQPQGIFACFIDDFTRLFNKCDFK